MPNPDKWTISNGANQPAVGADLDKLHIKKTANHYELYAKLQSVSILPGNPIISRNNPLVFTDVSYDGQTWDITITQLATSQDPRITDAGTWVTPSAQAMRDDDTTPTSGELTVQTDGGVVPAEEAAASAGHGKN